MMNRVTSQQAHAEYMLHTFFYITRLVTEGDYGQIAGLGLTEDQAKQISAMPVDELHELALIMRSNLFKAAFDTEILNSAFLIHQRKSKERREMMAMILGGASCANMTEFYGINKAAYTQMRSHAGLSENDIGRPAVPDEHTQRFIWSVWLQHQNLDDQARLLAVHAATQIKIRSLWQLLTEWRRTELTPEILSPAELNTRLSLTATQTKLTVPPSKSTDDEQPAALH